MNRRVAPTTPASTTECNTAAVAKPERNGMNPAMLVACEAITLPPTVAVQRISVGELRATPRPRPMARTPLARRSGDESSIEPPRTASRSAAAANQQRAALPPSQRIQAAGGHWSRALTPIAPAHAQITSPMQEPRPIRKAGHAPRSMAVRTIMTLTTPSSILMEKARAAPRRKISTATRSPIQ